MRLSRSLSVTTKLVLVGFILLFSGTPASATYAGRNGRITFVSDVSGTLQLYTINPDGSDMVQITNLPPTGNAAWWPDYSPDGRKIIFSHDMTGPVELYVINADGSGLAQLTHDNGLNFFPRWSPDGTHIVFIKINDFDNGVVTTMRADGSGPETSLTDDVWDRAQAEYTPDGRHIVFQSGEGGLVSAIWIMNVNGSNRRRLTAAEIEAGGPDVSPDGKHIAFYSQQNTPRPTHVFVMNLDGTGILQLTPNELVSLDPTYSPDGTKIAFQGGDSLETSGNLFTMNADGSDITKIASGLVKPENCFIGNCLIPDWGAKP